MTLAASSFVADRPEIRPDTRMQDLPDREERSEGSGRGRDSSKESAERGTEKQGRLEPKSPRVIGYSTVTSSLTDSAKAQLPARDDGPHAEAERAEPVADDRRDHHARADAG